jgi:hypothetical protein
MKKTLNSCLKLILTLFLFGVEVCNAKLIDSTLAKQVAKNFYNQNAKSQKEILTLAYIEKLTNNIPLYFIFNINQDDGFVVVAADDASLPILGYSLLGHFIKSNQSPEQQYFMEEYTKQIIYIKTNNLQPSAKIISKWNAYYNNQINFATSTSVSPLLGNLQWAQTTPYNTLCPSNSPTGCVATAMAQIMEKWNYPSHGTGVIPSYTSQTNSYNIPSINLDATTYNWSNMPNQLDNNSSSAQINAIATLMYHCGVSVQMDYTPSTSGSWIVSNDQNGTHSHSAEIAFKTYFNYNISSIIGTERNNFSSSNWIILLKNELDNDRPILYGGWGTIASQPAAHAWVCDGYDANNFFHMNWGWGGAWNNGPNNDGGFWNLDNLYFPNGTGTDNLNLTQQALIGIQPRCDLTIINPQVSSTTVNAGSNVTVYFAEDNSGYSNAAPNYVSFHLSGDDVLTPAQNGDFYLDEYFVNQTLAPQSQTSSLSKQILIPSNTPPGPYYLFFSADGSQIISEGDELNNFATVQINVVSVLGCTSPFITAHPLSKTVTAPAGTSFSIQATGSDNTYQWQVYTGSVWSNINNSTPYSGAYTTTLNISSTSTSMSGYQYRCKVSSACSGSTITSAAAFLTVNPSSAGCNNDYPCSPKVLPITISCINTSCSTIGATPPSPDITFKSCSGIFYQTDRYDDDVWFSITTTSSSPITIKVTPTSNLSNFDPVIGLYSNNCATPTQLPGGCADVYPSGGTEQLVYTPTAGTTYLVRVFGYGPGGAYSGNFDICVTTVGQAAPADLIITDPLFSNNSPCAGDAINVLYNIENIGSSNAGTSSVKYYLSSNNTFSADDVLLGSTSVNSINSGASASYSKNLNIPAGTSAGPWYILIIADANDDISEGSNGEANNLFTNSIQVNNCSGSADLVIHYNSSTPTTITPGALVRVNYTMQNLGTVAASPIHIGIYISADNVFDPHNDEFLNDWVKGSLNANETSTDILNFTVPNCYSCGSFYVFLVIDYDNVVNETNNNNNSDYFPIQITGCTSCTFSVPPTGINFQSAGGSGNFNITTTNCCPWSAIANDNWITLINGSGYGNGVVSYSVAPCNSGGTRTGTITAAGQLHTITQNCIETCNASQSFEWALQAGSTTLSDAAADLAIDASGNLYMTGDIQGSADFGGGIILTTPSVAPDIFVSKHNSSGQIQWAVRYGNTNQDEGTAIAIDNSGNIYVAGNFVNSVTFGSTTLTSNVTNENAAFLLKLNSSGVLLWATKINATDIGSASHLVIDNNNNIFVSGNLNQSEQLFISKYDISGTQLWYNTYGGTGIYVKSIFGIAADNSGNIFICGRYMNTITLGSITLNATYAILDIDGFTAKLDGNGNVIWAQKLTSPGQGQDELRAIAIDDANNIYTVGNVDSTAIIGNITIPLSPGSKEIIIKYDQDGNPLWAKAAVSGYNNNPQAIVKGIDNNMYFCGDFSGTMQIDSFAITSAGGNDAFIIRCDENGKIKWMKGFGGTGDEGARGMVTNSSNDVFVAGGFNGTVTFGNTTLTSAGSEDIYLAKFKQCDPPVVNITYNGNLVLCPEQTLTLSTSYCSTNTYQWQLNNIEIPSANNPTYIASEPGEYRVKVSAFAGCETLSDPTIIASQGTYSFTGTGNWDVASNWANNAIPPSPLPSCYEIIIDPQIDGECILNVIQILSPGAKLTVLPGKKFRVPSIQGN